MRGQSGLHKEHVDRGNERWLNIIQGPPQRKRSKDMKSLNLKTFALYTIVLFGFSITLEPQGLAKQKDNSTTTSSDPTEDFDSKLPRAKKKNAKKALDKPNPKVEKHLQTPQDPEMRNRKEDVD